MSRASVLAVVALGAAAAALPALAQDAADRYGPPPPSYGPPSHAAYPVAASPGVAPTGMRGRMLSWPGKSDPGAEPAYAPPQAVRASTSGGYPSPAYSGAARPTHAFASAAPYSGRSYPAHQTAAQRYATPYAAPRPYAGLEADGRSAPPRAYAQPSYAAPPSTQSGSPDGWRPVFAETPVQPPMQAPPAGPALAGAPSGSEAPTSIYTPASTSQMTPAQRAAAAPPPLRSASAARRYGYDPTEDHQVRFYSVHRPFGLQPDAAPIPPQFFTATADLSQPAGPLPNDRTTTTTTASGTRVSHVAPDTGVN